MILALPAGPAGLAHAADRAAPRAGDARAAKARSAPTGSVIFFHPDGTGLSHWQAARLYFRGPDGGLHWDRLPYLAAYRGHLATSLTATSNGGATTHAFGHKVDAPGSFGRDGDGKLSPPTDRAILSLSGYPGSLMREAANAGLPVGIVNDGHIGEPGTGAFLAEVGHRDDWQEITRQMILGRPGFEGRDADPWVILGGGEADTRPAGTTLLHRNVNQERSAPLHSRRSLRTDDLDLEAAWNVRGRGDASNDPRRLDDYLVVKTRAEFERLRTALAAHPDYAPRVLGVFAFQDLCNDRDEQDLINRGFVREGLQPGEVGPAPLKRSRLVLWGDHDPREPGFDPPSFAELTEVAILILDRAARQQRDPARRRFFLVAEQEGNDNFGNNGNAVGVLHALRDTDEAIGAALRHLAAHPRTLILTAADSEAGGLQVLAPNRAGVKPATNVLAPGSAPDVAGTAATNPSAATPAGVPAGTTVLNFVDGVEGRQSRLFVSEPDQFGNRMQFGIVWPGTSDYSGGIVSRAAGQHAELLQSRFSERFDNVDVYRLMHLSLFGRLLDSPTTRAPSR
jgi:alkaline phosphatase